MKIEMHKSAKIFIYLFLLSVAPAAGQITQHEYYDIMKDSTSFFHVRKGEPFDRGTSCVNGSFNSFPVRVITAEKDTFVCSVRLYVGHITPSYEKRAKNAVVWANLYSEDHHPFFYREAGDKECVSSQNKYYHKLRRHMRLKLNTYHFTSDGKKLKRVTAYIDYFPYGDYSNMVRYKVKHIKTRTGEKYRVTTRKIEEKIQKRQEKDKKEITIWKNKLREKERQWYEDYQKKYYPTDYEKHIIK